MGPGTVLAGLHLFLPHAAKHGNSSAAQRFGAVGPDAAIYGVKREEGQGRAGQACH